MSSLGSGLPSAPLWFTGMNDSLVFGLKDGLYQHRLPPRTGSGSDVDMLHDSDEIFEDSVFLNDAQDQQKGPQLSYKYKWSALDFAEIEGLIFSLHLKSSGSCSSYFVECCSKKDFQCVNCCVGIITSPESSENCWILSQKCESLSNEFVKSNFNGCDVEIVVFFNLGKATYMVPFSSTSQISSSTPKVLDTTFSKKYEFLCDLSIQKTRKEDRSDLMEFLKEKLYGADEADCDVNVNEVKDVLKVDNGTIVYVLLKTGKVLKYRKGFKIRRFDIFKEGGFLISSDDHNLYVYHISGDVFKMPHSCDQECEGVAVFEDIMRAIDRLDEVNLERLKQEKLSDQIKFLSKMNREKPFKTSTKVTEGQLIIVIENCHQTFQFPGEYWTFRITLVDKNIHKSFTRALSSVLRPKDVYETNVGRVDFDENFGPITLIVQADICFKNEIRSSEIHRAELSALDFIVCDGLQSTSRKVLNEANMYDDRESIETFLERLNATRPINRLSNPDNGVEDLRPASITSRFSSFLVDNYKENYPVGDFILAISSFSNSSSTIANHRCSIGRSAFNMAMTKQQDMIKVDFSGTRVETLISLKKSLGSRMCSVLEKLPSVQVHKDFIRHLEKARRMFNAVEIGDDSEENLAVLEICYNHIRENVSHHL